MRILVKRRLVETTDDNDGGAGGAARYYIVANSAPPELVDGEASTSTADNQASMPKLSIRLARYTGPVRSIANVETSVLGAAGADAVQRPKGSRMKKRLVVGSK